MTQMKRTLTLFFCCLATTAVCHGRAPSLDPPAGVPTLERFLCYGHVVQSVPSERYYCWCRQDRKHRFQRLKDRFRCVVRENGHYVMEDVLRTEYRYLAGLTMQLPRPLD